MLKLGVVRRRGLRRPRTLLGRRRHVSFLLLRQLAQELTVDPEEWRKEIPLIEQWFAEIGDSVSSSLRDELDSLKLRLASNP